MRSPGNHNTGARVGALVVGQRLQGIQQLVHHDAKGGVTANHVGGWRAVEDHRHDDRAEGSGSPRPPAYRRPELASLEVEQQTGAPAG
jgi:hypothetical protein